MIGMSPCVKHVLPDSSYACSVFARHSCSSDGGTRVGVRTRLAAVCQVDIAIPDFRGDRGKRRLGVRTSVCSHGGSLVATMVGCQC
jgi:hypothetical protein